MRKARTNNDLYILPPEERRRAKAAAREARRAARRPFGVALRAYLSVFYLFVRRRAGVVALLLGALVLLEGLLFGVGLMGEIGKLGTLPGPVTFGVLLSNAGVILPFYLVLLLLTALLSGLAPAGRNRTYLTVGRLGVSVGGYYLMEATFAAMCYLALAAVQVLFVFGAGLVYLSAFGGAELVGVNGTAILSVFYQHSLLHGLLPLADVTRWVATGFILVGLSVATAHADFGQRHRRAWVAAAIAMVVLVILYPQSMGLPGQDLLIIPPIAALAMVLMIRRWFKEERE